jgi:hypothetical protein
MVPQAAYVSGAGPVRRFDEDLDTTHLRESERFYATSSEVPQIMMMYFLRDSADYDDV